EVLIYLSDMLKTNKTLIMLGLQDNKITDKAVQYKNKVIEEIFLDLDELITDVSIDVNMGLSII
ncbi:unnamed protein product, partial [Rotaria sp. Silwood1]